MEPLTNETVKNLIEESGEMWEAARDRTNSPVLLQVPNQWAGLVYELSLPAGEKHPFWRVTERELTSDERATQTFFLLHGPYLGDLINVGDGSYLRVRAYVFNGRKDGAWDHSVDHVNVEIVASASISSHLRREK